MTGRVTRLVFAVTRPAVMLPALVKAGTGNNHEEWQQNLLVVRGTQTKSSRTLMLGSHAAAMGNPRVTESKPVF